MLDPHRNWTAMVETLVYGVYDGDLDAFARDCRVCRRSVYVWLTGRRPSMRSRWRILKLYVERLSGAQAGSAPAAAAPKPTTAPPPPGPSSS
jgi:hypothetical protein